MSLTQEEKQKLRALIQAGKPLPSIYKGKLFDSQDGTFVQATKEYRLVYDGKARREVIIANTPEAPFQLVRSFNSGNPFRDGWRNMLIYGDNLLALKELYADQRGLNKYGTRDKIKLIYIDPPFATRQDFMKDREKAYRDKVIGAQFIEFMRKRLILLHEVLASDGSIYVHLDTKKGHYIKAILDEIFGEHNFQNELIWKRTPFAGSSKARAERFPINHDSIFLYSKGDGYIFTHQYEEYSDSYKRRFKYRDGEGWYRKTSLKTYSAETEARLRAAGRFLEPQKKGAYPSYKQYLHQSKGKQIEDIWTDINIDNPMSESRAEFEYPRMKPERLLSRIITASSRPGDIVLDAFAGSGPSIGVAEKLGRRWIGMDCGKLAIYTMQKRMVSLSTSVGLPKKDERHEVERTADFEDHLKNSAGLLLVTEQARKGECDITTPLLEDLAELIRTHDLARKGTPFSLVCPQGKLKIAESKLDEVDEDDEMGQKKIRINGVEFRISIIEPKQKPEKEKPLKAKEFALFNAGIYDNKTIKEMPWEEYRPFVLKLFQVREHKHEIKGFSCDGYIGTHSAYVWNYPEHKKLTIDYDYVKSLHDTMEGRAGEKFYVIAPVVAMAFLEDEVEVGETNYVFLKVPISILMRLLNSGEVGALKQPTREGDVNKVIDAVGFDFVSQPIVKIQCKKERAPDAPLLKEYAIHLTEFRSNTLSTDPEDFANFETFSMAMVDTDYDGKVFKLSRVYWADTLIAEELIRVKYKKKENEVERLAACKRLSIRVADEAFSGQQMMAIFCDRYGNEKALVFKKKDFR